MYAERISNSRNIITMHPGSFVMDCTAVQSDNSKDKVAKLHYSVRRPSNIIKGIYRGNYTVRKLNKPDSPEFKFISEDLYILLPSLKPCEPVDGSDTSYLNQYHTSIAIFLKKT